MKILKNKDLVFISRTLVVKASGNTLISTNVLKWMTFPQTFQPSFSNGCLLSSPSPFGPLWIPTRLGALQELDRAVHKKSLSWSYSLACILNSQITSRIVLGQVQAVGSLLKLAGNGCACTELPRHSQASWEAGRLWDRASGTELCCHLILQCRIFTPSLLTLGLVMWCALTYGMKADVTWADVTLRGLLAWLSLTSCSLGFTRRKASPK